MESGSDGSQEETIDAVVLDGIQDVAIVAGLACQEQSPKAEYLPQTTMFTA